MDSIKALRKKCQRKTDVIYDTLFTRQVSIYLTAALIPFKVSPNAVSIVNCIAGLAACAFIGAAQTPWVFIGVGLLHLYAVLDSVDGELARYFGRTSIRGVFLESWSAYMQINAFNLAAGMYLLHTQELRHPLWIAVGIAAFGRNVMPCARRTVLSNLDKFSADDSVAPAEGTGGRQGGFFKKLSMYLNEHVFFQTNMWLVVSSLVLVEAVFHPPIPLVLYAFYFYAFGLAAKEGALFLTVFFTGFLNREINRAAATLRKNVSAK